MYIDIFLLVLLIGSIFCLAIGVLFTIGMYTGVIKRMERNEEEKVLLQTNITKKAKDLLQDAHANNLSIIAEANRKAAEILQETGHTKLEADAELKKKLQEVVTIQQQTLQKLSSDFMAAHQKSLQAIESQDTQELKKVTALIESTVQRQLAQFSKALEQETVGMESEVKQKIQAEFQKAEADIAGYRNAQYEKIQASLYPLLQRVTEIVLGKALSPQDHEVLILKALEEAQAQMNQSTPKYTNEHQQSVSTSAS